MLWQELIFEQNLKLRATGDNQWEYAAQTHELQTLRCLEVVAKKL